MTLAHSFPDDPAELRKARGAFFTPSKVAQYVTAWAVRDNADTVLEPSCGDAVFLVEAARRLRELGAITAEPAGAERRQLHGVELHAESAARAHANVVAEGMSPEISVGDFFTTPLTMKFDAIIGNPPYIRYQDFAGEARTRSREAALRAGVNLPALASSWAAFTIHSATFLKPGGRMGLVLPAELLGVNYAAGVRRFLMQKFSQVSLVMFEERVFPGVLEEVVLLLADGYEQGSTDHMVVHQVRGPDDLKTGLEGYRWSPVNPEDKWTPSLVGSDDLEIYERVVGSAGFTGLETWGDTTLGMVTGNNKFFALSSTRVRELHLEPDDVVRLSPPGSKHLRGLDLTARSVEELDAEDAATWLFRPQGGPSKAAEAYIAAGQKAGANLSYKCRIRTPWWRVPLQAPADLLLTYMNSDTPRITTNAAKVHHLNSVHGIYLRAELRQLGAQILPLGALNSVTLLGAETVGRAYGGGMLKLEPREADVLPVPSVNTLLSAKSDLLRIRREVAKALSQGQLLVASALVDDVLLQHGVELSPQELEKIRRARATLVARRVTRGSESRRS